MMNILYLCLSFGLSRRNWFLCQAVFGPADATIPRVGRLANAGMQQLTPRPQASITTRGQFDDVEHTFKFWVSGTEAGRHGLWQAWEAIDYNGNGIVSLAEIDKWVVETYPKLNNKSVRSLMERNSMTFCAYLCLIIYMQHVVLQ